MSTISIVGRGTMARQLAVSALGAGHEVEILGRDEAGAGALATELGGGATAGVVGVGTPTGDIVILAVPYASAPSIVSGYGTRLAGKVVVDVSNPFDPSGTGVVTPRDSSAAQEIAAAAAPGTRVVKAFNTLFAGVLAAGTAGRPVDVFLAGDDADAKESVASFVTSLGLRPLDTGDLAFAHWLEGAGLLILGQAVRQEDFSLTVTVSG